MHDRVSEFTDPAARFSRRQFALSIPAFFFAAAIPAACSRSPASQIASELVALEERVGGRLGVCLHDAVSGTDGGHRMDERFGMCSTFKLPLAGLVLREIDRGRLSADQFVPYSEQDMVPYAPVTQEYLQRGGMTVIELAAAAQVTSDNVAANLLLKLIDGPAGFTASLREFGDDTTRLDRYEPTMNLVPPGEIRDTTTPRAMAATVAGFLMGHYLQANSREMLISWTIGTKTGRRRIRAGLPADWLSGDKTGTAIGRDMPNKTNDVAATWPTPDRGFTISAYYEADKAYNDMRRSDEQVLADVGRIVATVLQS